MTCQGPSSCVDAALCGPGRASTLQLLRLGQGWRGIEGLLRELACQPGRRGRMSGHPRPQGGDRRSKTSSLHSSLETAGAWHWLPTASGGCLGARAQGGRGRCSNVVTQGLCVCSWGGWRTRGRGRWLWPAPACTPSVCCSCSRAPVGPEAGKLAAERARAPVVPFGVDLCYWGQEQPMAGKILK